MSWCIRYLALVAFCIAVVDCLVSNTASIYQCKLGCNSVGSPSIFASRLQRGRIELHMSDSSREDEIRKKVRHMCLVPVMCLTLINDVICIVV